MQKWAPRKSLKWPKEGFQALLSHFPGFWTSNYFGWFSRQCKCYAVWTLGSVIFLRKALTFLFGLDFQNKPKKKVFWSAAQVSTVILFSMCSRVPQPHGLSVYMECGGLPFWVSFFWFPHSTFLLGWLWWFQTLAFSPSDQKEWISTGVAVVPSSSNCDLFLGEKPQKQERSSTPFLLLNLNFLLESACLRSYFSIFGEMVLFMCLCFSFCFVFYAEFTIVT